MTKNTPAEGLNCNCAFLPNDLDKNTGVVPPEIDSIVPSMGNNFGCLLHSIILKVDSHPKKYRPNNQEDIAGHNR